MTFLICHTSYGQNLSVELEPIEPVAGEIFQMNVTIETTSRAEPYISFDPGKSEVQGRRNIGTSVQTTIINGVVETKRITRYTYDLIVNEPGRLIIREINADIDGKVLKHERIETNVLRERKRPDKYFLRAEISKMKLFLGEGATVNYYLYFRVPVLGTEIRDFPKLNNFIKRFHMPPEQVETIEEAGVLYRRKLIYSARVYPEQVGTLEIDPLKIRLQYSMQSNNSSPFSGFGLSSRQSQVRNSQSDPLNIEVLPLPLDSMPKEFTGLIGRHSFSLNMRREKYLVNEPIEVKLEVSGPGALENLSPPTILQSKLLENFDTESEFEEIDKQRARKTFEYTYLARAPLNMDEKTLEFFYFDPIAKDYKSEKVRIPGMTVSGGGTDLSRLNTEENKTVGDDRGRSTTKSSPGKNLIAPYWSTSGPSSMLQTPFNFMNLFFGILLFCCCIFIGQQYIKKIKVHDDLEHYALEMKRHGITYRNVFNLFDSYRLAVGVDGQKFLDIIDELKLSEPEKKYFHSLLTQAEKESFKDSKEVLSLKFNKRYFDNLVKKLQQAIHESHSES